jgi:hypothetical protein
VRVVSSVRELETPSGWAPPRAVPALGLAAALLAFGLLIAAVGLTGLDDADTPLSFPLSFVLMGTGLAAGAVPVLRRGFRRSAVRGVDLVKADDGPPVLRIRQLRAVQLIGALMLMLFGGGALLLGVAQLVAGAIGGVVMLACGVALAGMPLVVLLRGAPLTEIRLDAHAVQLRGGGRWLTAAWDDVEYLFPVETRHQRLIVLEARNVERRPERFSWTTRAQRRRDAERIDIATEHFGLDHVLLYHLLRFYHENPLARTELGTATALRRVREARFDVYY